MKIGLVGLPKSGKTTIFNALTKSSAEVSAYSGGKAEPNLASVAVEDVRVTRLSEIYRPKKTTFASVDITDFAGFSDSAGESSTFPQELLQLIRNNDALAVVLRNFQSVLDEAPSPSDDLSTIEGEFLLADHLIVESRLERMTKAKRTGQFTSVMEGEEKLLIRLQAHLEAGHPLRGLDLAGNEEKSVRGFQFLTLKPLMVVLNSAEDNFGQNEAALAELSKRFPTIEYAGSFEMELSHLSDEEEIEAFLADIGITESARLRLTRTAYEILGSISFFTVGKDEVRAWNISQGDKALDAAATIHSDLARGFIRAECFSYDDFLACGGDEKAVKDARKFRLEGRDYVVKDGDMICIRFNV
jgi:GTP-binding protein YchF